MILASVCLAAQLGAQGPLSPQEALPLFRLDAGLSIELAAAEPEIESPVAMAFDENGKLWVVEMLDYPTGPPEGSPAEGRIKALEDLDGDGRYEHASVFAEHLLFANGLMPWRGGLIVTCAPHILYLKDTDGDGKADLREELYEGFSAQNPQLRVSHPTLGIDNWVYVANGQRGGKIQRSGRGDAGAIDINGMDFRFDLIGDRHEPVSGFGQFGLTFDDWGQRFVCTNRNHLIHIAMPNEYLRRNPFLAPPAVAQDNQGPGGAARVYPLSRNWTTATYHAGTFTAACGILVYRGSLLPASYRGSVFTCEPTGNLVHQEVLSQDGATFHGRPARDGVEFLATPDGWFRPVSQAHGPDGALYIVDMYRKEIEHPEWVPAEMRARMDFQSGKDRGRIWRIVPEGHRAAPESPRLQKAATAELVARLESPDVWWRTTAHRLLLERQDGAAWEPLRRLVTTSPEPLARLHGAWLLEGLHRLDLDIVLRLLGDPHPRVRENAARLSERWVAISGPIQERLAQFAGDPDPQARFQAALSLGSWDDDRALAPLKQIALAGAEDRWTRLAVEAALPKRAGAMLASLLGPSQHFTDELTPGHLALVSELSALVGARHELDEVSQVFEALFAPEGQSSGRWELRALLGLADGISRRGMELGALLEPLKAKKPRLAGRVQPVFEEASALALDPGRAAEERLDSVRLLAHAPWESAKPSLARLLVEDPSQEVRLAAARSISAHHHPQVAHALLEPWPRHTPAVRREVSAALLRQEDRLACLLDEVEAHRFSPQDLDAGFIRQLVNDGRQPIRERARRLLQSSLPEDRKQVVERYQQALALKSDPLRGQAVFEKRCAMCHRVGALGATVGPDLSDVAGKAPEALLTDILDPNQAIDANYVQYTVVTKSGSVLSGVLSSESVSSVTLRRAENQTDSILRQDIAEIRSSGVSLMPEGAEKDITVEEMADLISFLKNWRYSEGTLRGK